MRALVPKRNNLNQKIPPTDRELRRGERGVSPIDIKIMEQRKIQSVGLGRSTADTLAGTNTKMEGPSDKYEHKSHAS
jgi:hypothetical protein